ncbi:sodium/solute symporter [bacterium]|nr:sodium/solute symporter [bacterium]
MNNIATLDYIIFFLYFAIVISIAIWVSTKPKGEERTSEDYFLAGRALPWWIIGASLIASNISAEQMIGMTGTAFASGIAVVSYEWMAAVTLLIVAKWFLPTFLKMRIYSMPQYLENRFDARVSMGLGVFWLLVYVFVNLTSVLYLGALTLHKISGLPLWYGIIGLAAISLIYTLYGGLSAVAWTDIIQVAVLFFGGTALTYVGLDAVSDGGGAIAGFEKLMEVAPDRFHTFLPWNHPDLPWIGVFIGGLWIANISYWGLNQYITQRALAGKNIREAQFGLVFAAFLKVIVPIVVLLPGIIVYVMFYDQIPVNDLGEKQNDAAYAMLISQLSPTGLTGLVIAALIAAIVSSLNSMTNSSATIFTMDIYRKFDEKASERRLVFIGRVTSLVAVVIAIFMAPMMQSFDQMFQYIQEYTGFVSPGVVAIFLYGLFWKRATSAAALWMVILTIPLSVAFKFLPDLIIPGTATAEFINPFLHRMGLTFIILMIVGYVVSLMTTPKPIDIEEEPITYSTTFAFNLCSILILGALAALYTMLF